MIKGIDYPGITTGAIIVKPSKGILLVHRTDQCRDERRTRDLIGGGIDFGDTALQTIKKEVKEEVDLTVTNDQITYLGFREQFRVHNDKPTHRIGFYYLIMLTEDQEATIMEPHKFDSLDYFPPDDLPPRDKTNSIVYPTLIEFQSQIEQLIGKSLAIK